MKKCYVATAGLLGCLPNINDVFSSHEEALVYLLTVHDLAPQGKYGQALDKWRFVTLPLEKYGNEYMSIDEWGILEYLDNAGVADDLEGYLKNSETPDFIRDYFREASERGEARYNGLEIRGTVNGYMAYCRGKALSLGDGVGMATFNDQDLLVATEAWWDVVQMTIEVNLTEMERLVQEHGTWTM